MLEAAKHWNEFGGELADQDEGEIEEEPETLKGKKYAYAAKSKKERAAKVDPLPRLSVKTLKESLVEMYGAEQAPLIMDMHHKIQNLRDNQLNAEQKEGAHRFLVRGEPVISIQAPPGTGKTVLLAYVVNLLLELYPDIRILICAQQTWFANK